MDIDGLCACVAGVRIRGGGGRGGSQGALEDVEVEREAGPAEREGLLRGPNQGCESANNCFGSIRIDRRPSGKGSCGERNEESAREREGKSEKGRGRTSEPGSAGWGGDTEKGREGVANRGGGPPLPAALAVFAHTGEARKRVRSGQRERGRATEAATESQRREEEGIDRSERLRSESERGRKKCRRPFFADSTHTGARRNTFAHAGAPYGPS